MQPPHQKPHGDLAVRWTLVLRDVYGNGTFEDGRSTTYGLEAVDVGDRGTSLIVHARFLSGHTYCCEMSGCHFSVSGLPVWRRIRRAMERRSLGHVGLATIRALRVTWESGSSFLYPCAKDGSPRVLHEAQSEIHPGGSEPRTPDEDPSVRRPSAPRQRDG